MKNIYFLFLMIVVVGMCEKTSAQSRWIGIMPMEFNPSFAGNTGMQRVVTFAGYTHSKEGQKVTTKGRDNYFFKSHWTSGGVSYDNFIPKIASGIGFFASLQDGQRKSFGGELNGSTLNTGLIISPKISIKGKYTLAPSAGFNYTHENISIRNIGIDTSRLMTDILNLSLGLLFNSEKFYIGYAHYFSPFYGDNHMRYRYSGNVQAGYTFQKTKEAKASYTLQSVFCFDQLGYYNQLRTSFTFKYNKLILGVMTTDNIVYILSGYGYQDVVHAGIGYQSKRVKIFYSQDVTNINYVYRGELSCRVFIPSKKRSFNPIYN